MIPILPSVVIKISVIKIYGLHKKERHKCYHLYLHRCNKFCWFVLSMMISIYTMPTIVNSFKYYVKQKNINQGLPRFNAQCNPVMTTDGHQTDII